MVNVIKIIIKSLALKVVMSNNTLSIISDTLNPMPTDRINLNSPFVPSNAINIAKANIIE